MVFEGEIAGKFEVTGLCNFHVLSHSTGYYQGNCWFMRRKIVCAFFMNKRNKFLG